MSRVRFHAEAEEEVIAAEAWYRERSGVAAQAFILEVERAVVSIGEEPLRWPRGMRGERRFVLDRFPYTVMYRFSRDLAFITAVAHQSRRPGYWRHRR